MAEKNVKKLLRAVLGPVQTLEDTFQSIILSRRVNYATGDALDLLGKLVTQPRNGLDDESYRRFIRARIATNSSDGLVEELINISHLVIDDDDAYVHVANIGVAALHIIIEDIVMDTDLAEIVVSFLRQAASGGVRVVVEYWPEPEAQMFAFAPKTGLLGTGKGFGWTADPSVGGSLAGAIE